jgi:hypothetical protein
MRGLTAGREVRDLLDALPAGAVPELTCAAAYLSIGNASINSSQDTASAKAAMPERRAKRANGARKYFSG